MAKFIRVHIGNEQCLVNLDHVVRVRNYQNCTLIMTAGSFMSMPTDESFEEVARMIASATGGIPIGGKT